MQPLLGVLLFLGLWQWGASQVQTSLGTLPGLLATASQLWSSAGASAGAGEGGGFLERQQVRNAARLAADPAAEVKLRPCHRASHLLRSDSHQPAHRAVRIRARDPDRHPVRVLLA